LLHLIGTSMRGPHLATLTNVNFDHNRFVALIGEAAKLRDGLRASYASACLAAGKTPEVLAGPASFVPADTLSGLLAQAGAVGVRAGIDKVGTGSSIGHSMLARGSAHCWRRPANRPSSRPDRIA
jgi:hydroxylamine reductase